LRDLKLPTWPISRSDRAWVQRAGADVATGSEPSHRVAFTLYRCLHVASACTNVKAELTPRPSSRSPFSPPLCRLHRARERKPSAAAAVATAAEHHQPIPRSHRRTVNSSPSSTTPHHRWTSGRARRACASTTAAIIAVKPSLHAAAPSGSVTACLYRSVSALGR
jgi:hypothetical protein